MKLAGETLGEMVENNPGNWLWQKASCLLSAAWGEKA